MMMGLTRHEKEELVLELYSQGKNHREIAKEARVSLRDIGPILNKGGIEQSLSVSSKAYKLFSEDKTPLQVAIALNLKEPEANQFYKEYLRLDNFSNLNLFYEQVKDDLGFFVNLYKSAVASGFDVQHVVRLLNIANNDLPAVEYRYQKLMGEEASLKAGNRNAAITFQQLSDDISEEYKTLDRYRSFCKQQVQEIKKISLQKIGLERYIEEIQKNNDVYLKTKEAIKQEIKSILTNPRQLLSIALVSLIESSRTDPRKFYALCYNKDITTITTTTSSTTRAPSTVNNGRYDYTSSINEGLLPLDYGTSDESFEKMLLDESERLYARIIDDVVSKTINFTKGKNIWSFQPETQSPLTESESLHKLSTFTYRKEEEQSCIQSEIGG